ncbi:hypothetical protein [Actinomadura sp. 3N508]|uniref:hypothetical protein n=1 Tax=Actinomadura sp. 3N508 TaxID=3375153 RepID=UPI0037B8CAF4
MHETIAATGLLGGASVLPQDAGAWARLLGDRSPRWSPRSTGSGTPSATSLLAAPAP